jgi:hypothetical protein
LKFGDVLRGEVRDLVSSRAVERLHKNVIQALIANDLGHGFPIRSEAHRVGEAISASCSHPGIGLKQGGRRTASFSSRVTSAGSLTSSDPP